MWPWSWMLTRMSQLLAPSGDPAGVHSVRYSQFGQRCLITFLFGSAAFSDSFLLSAECMHQTPAGFLRLKHNGA